MEALRQRLARATHPLAVQVGLLIAAGGVVLDQATKEVAEHHLRPSQYVPWLSESIGWQLVYNPGGAFGLPAPSWVFFVVTAIVLVIVARTLPRTDSLLQASAYGMLLSGALGNLVDRILRPGDPDGFALTDGFVVDFVAWGAWPRFNVADSLISVGFVLLVIALWREERRTAHEPDASGVQDPSEGGDRDEPGGAGGGTPPEAGGADDAGVGRAVEGADAAEDGDVTGTAATRSGT